MREGVDVVYQATFFDGRWGGQADFLLRTDRPSDLGPWSYDIADTKLARRLKVPALLQMATYAERLTVLQGVPPQRLTVVTGDGVERPWRLDDVASYARRARARLLEAVEGAPTTEPAPVGHCSQCRWSAHCTSRWERGRRPLAGGGHALGAPPGADRGGAADRRGARGRRGVRAAPHDRAAVARAARAAGPAAGRASAPPASRPTSCSTRSRAGACCGCPSPARATSTSTSRATRSPPTAPAGSTSPASGTAAGASPRWWAHDADAEAELTRGLLDDLIRRLAADPGMHVYHYAAYEQTALKRLTGRHGTRETELDALLRGERFVDLYAVVRQGLRISKPSYSIKKLEDFYWGHTRTAADEGVADAMSSVVEYERFLVDGDTAVLDAIASTTARTSGPPTTCTPGWSSGGPSSSSGTGPCRVPAARTAPRARPSPTRRWPRPSWPSRLKDAGHALLAGVVGWHRREERPKWWDIYRLKDLDDEALLDDAAALGQLSAPTDDGDVKQSKRGATSSRRRTPRSARASASHWTSTPRRRSARSSRWTPPPAGWCSRSGAAGPRRPAWSGAAQAAGGQGAAGVDRPRRGAGARRRVPLGPRLLERGCPPRAAGPAGGAAGRPGGPGRARPGRRGARHPGPAGLGQDHPGRRDDPGAARPRQEGRGHRAVARGGQPPARGAWTGRRCKVSELQDDPRGSRRAARRDQRRARRGARVPVGDARRRTRPGSGPARTCAGRSTCWSWTRRASSPWPTRSPSPRRPGRWSCSVTPSS